MEPTLGMTQVAASSFPKAARLVRDSLAREGLTIVAEESHHPAMRTLYVVCPFLLLETLAFDQSAAVLVPAHVVLSARDNGAEVRWLNAAILRRAQTAAGVARPVNALHARIGSALRSLAERSRPFSFRGQQSNNGE
jgi:hypothetical protein